MEGNRREVKNSCEFVVSPNYQFHVPAVPTLGYETRFGLRPVTQLRGGSVLRSPQADEITFLFDFTVTQIIRSPSSLPHGGVSALVNSTGQVSVSIVERASRRGLVQVS
jgi:hypothetical protein